MTSQDSRKIRFGLWYDFRNPSQWHQSPDRLYREILDQIAWGEDNGFDDVWLSEHHFIEDGYLPSILPVAAAIAARTKRIRIASGVLLMPFHNPIRLAEDIATVDVISGGRFELGVGIGFKSEEFAGFGVPSKQRGARTDQSLDIVRRALSGETVTFKSEFFDFNNVRVTPAPIQKPHPPIWLGGFTPPALRRAVRFGDGFTVPGANRGVYDRYIAELKNANRATDNVRFASGFWCLIVSDDPEKTFAEAADHIIYQANNYSEWLSAGGLQPLAPHLHDREALRQSGLLQVVDPDTAISMIRNFSNEVPITHFYSWTLPPGLPPRWAEPYLELFAAKVIPAFR
ncbi:MAG TPA: LLM class flavin-dependent oxidoreductase [Stellaceae bacterium]|nr:LLM class flavin-dependent oxidoreductase [Stellaceae bacterium]